MSATERLNRWCIASVVLAALLIMAVALGAWQPGGFVVLGWLRRPFLFGTLALGLLALACWLAVRDRVWRLALASLLVVLALAWAALGALVMAALSEDLRELSRDQSPDGGRELVLYRGSNIIDPTWELRLRSGSGLTVREWDLGCVNSDVDSLTRVEWTGPDGLRVHLSRLGPVDVVLERSTGRPGSPISVGC